MYTEDEMPNRVAWSQDLPILSFETVLCFWKMRKHDVTIYTQ
jgi:hypothetical protein